MSSTVISSYTTIGLTLTAYTPNQVTITQTGAVNTAEKYAIHSVFGVHALIENHGTLRSAEVRINGGETYGYGYGIVLASSGTIANAASGDIYGASTGIVLLSPGIVDNQGTIIGIAGEGIYGGNGASITNGSPIDTSALIEGREGVFGAQLLENFGTIIGTGFGAVSLDYSTFVNGSTTDDHALAAGYLDGVQMRGGIALNYGTISGAMTIGSLNSSSQAVGINFWQFGNVINYGLIAGNEAIRLSDGGTLLNAGTVNGDFGAGTAVYFGGPSKLIVEPGAVFLGTVGGPGTVTMELGSAAGRGTITGLGTQFTDIETIAIDPGAAWVVSGDQAGLASGQVISGFNQSDALFLSGFQATSSTYAAGKLTLSDGVSIERLTISAVAASPAFHFSATAGGTEITLCFLRGTRLATPQGDVAVEALAVGDAVMTRFGGVQRIKWIGRQSFSKPFVESNAEKMPVRIAAGALSDGLPRRDLFVSPGHSMLLDGQLVLARLLVNGVTITQGEAPARIDYFHIELDAHDCVLAEDCWSESFADGPGLRAQYHNLAEFYAAWPDHEMPVAIALCAPRPVHGVALEAALAPVVARAAALLTPGALHGFVDLIGGDGVIEGWARDCAHPELPVALQAVYQGEVIGTALACQYRADLAAAGLGSGRCSFSMRVPAGLVRENIAICRAVDGAVLPLTTAGRASLAA